MALLKLYAAAAKISNVYSRFNPARLQKSLCFFLHVWQLYFLLGASGISFCVPLTYFFPLYPLSPTSLLTFFPVMRSTFKSDPLFNSMPATFVAEGLGSLNYPGD